MLGSLSTGVICLLIREITFRPSKCMWSQSIHVTDGQTDRRMTLQYRDPHSIAR